MIFQKVDRKKYSGILLPASEVQQSRTLATVKGPGTFNFRFRDALTVSIPLFNLSKTDKDKKILLSIGDEVFLNAGFGHC